MKRGGPIARRTPMPRGGPVKVRNPKRRESEFARCYHSKARVAWVKGLPCCWCNATTPSDNAHTRTDGMGRKADYTTIIPLCRACHRAYDERRAPFDGAYARSVAINLAADVEAAWQQRGGV